MRITLFDSTYYFKWPLSGASTDRQLAMARLSHGCMLRTSLASLCFRLEKVSQLRSHSRSRAWLTLCSAQLGNPGCAYFEYLALASHQHLRASPRTVAHKQRLLSVQLLQS